MATLFGFTQFAFWRHYLLLALLIVFVQSISSYYGVSGEGNQTMDLKAPKAEVESKAAAKLGNTGVLGVKPPARKRTRTTTVAIPSKEKKSDNLTADKKRGVGKEGTDTLLQKVGETFSKQKEELKTKETNDDIPVRDWNPPIDLDGEAEEEDDGNDDDGGREEVDGDDTDGSRTPGHTSRRSFEKNSDNSVRQSERTSDKTSNMSKPQKDESSSSSVNFMTYFIVCAVVVVLVYLVFHNKKKLMGFIVEGRNTDRGRRRRTTTSTEYKPLSSAEEGQTNIDNA